MNCKKWKVPLYNELYSNTKQINSLNIDNDTNCFGDEIAFNSNKKYKHLQKIIFL